MATNRHSESKLTRASSLTYNSSLPTLSTHTTRRYNLFTRNQDRQRLHSTSTCTPQTEAPGSGSSSGSDTPTDTKRQERMSSILQRAKSHIFYNRSSVSTPPPPPPPPPPPSQPTTRIKPPAPSGTGSDRSSSSNGGSLQECVQLLRAKMADTRLKLMALERLEQGISWLSKTGTDERIVSSLVTLLQADANLGSFSIGPELTDGMQHRDESSQQTLEASIAQLITNPPQPSVDPPSALEAGTDSHADQVQQSENDGSTLGHETNDTEHREPREDDDEQDSVLDSFFAECHEDLINTTLSDMERHRKQAILDIWGEVDTSCLAGDQHLKGKSGSLYKETEIDRGNRSYADITCQIMTKLDRMQKDVPTLQAETIPYGSMTFMTCADPMEADGRDTHTHGNSAQKLRSSTNILPDYLINHPTANDPTIDSVMTGSSPKRTNSGNHPLRASSPNAFPDCQQQPSNQPIANRDRTHSHGQEHRTLRFPGSPLAFRRSTPSLPPISIPSYLPDSIRTDPGHQSTRPASVYSSAREEFSQSFSSAIHTHGRVPSKPSNLRKETLGVSMAEIPQHGDASTISSALPTKLAITGPSKPPCQRLDMSAVHPPKWTSANAAGEDGSHWPRHSPASTCHSHSRSCSPILAPSLGKSPSCSEGFYPTYAPRQPSKGLPLTPVSPCSTLTKPPLIKRQHGWFGLQTLDVQMLASGRCHIVAITRWNHVYSCWEPNSDVRGCAKGKANEADIEEALGRSITTDIDTEFAHDTTFQPELVRFHEDLDALPSRIVKVVCSDSATFLLTEDGDLWGWGSFEDPKGTKVSPLSQDIASRPVRIITQQVKDVVCGGNHVLILTLSGLVVSWGSNDRCQLGRPNSTTSLSSLQEVADSDLSTCAVHGLPRYVMGIGAGKKTSFVWDKERLCGWGDNTFGQLCTDLTDVVMVPRCILPLWKGHVIKQVKGGEGHTVILKMDGHAMTMGNNDFGQLGRSRSSPLSASLAELREAPYSNMISEPTSAREPRTRLHPGPVPISGIEDISCGDYFTLARCSNGQVSTWGRGVTVHCLYNGRNEKTGARGGTSGSGSEASRKVVAISAMCGSVSIALVSSKVGQSN